MRPTLFELLQADTSKMSKEELRAHLRHLRAWQKKDIHQMLEDEAEGRPEHEGFIYILSNKEMPGLLKIGYTGGPVEKRAAEIGRATGVPGPFTIEKKLAVYLNPSEVEQKVHRALRFARTNDNREFFRISIDEAIPIIEAVLDGGFDPP